MKTDPSVYLSNNTLTSLGGLNLVEKTASPFKACNILHIRIVTKGFHVLIPIREAILQDLY